MYLLYHKYYIVTSVILHKNQCKSLCIFTSKTMYIFLDFTSKTMYNKYVIRKEVTAVKNLKNAESDNVIIEFKAVLLLLLDLLEHGETDRAIQRIKEILEK